MKQCTLKKSVSRFAKKYIENDKHYIKNYQYFIILILNDEPGLLKEINFMLFLCDEPGVLPMTHQFNSYNSGMTQITSKITHPF